MRTEPLTPMMIPAWDGFVRAHADGWFWHTSAWLEYQRHYREGNLDLSFAIIEDREAPMRTHDAAIIWAPTERHLLGVVPLMISHGPDGVPAFSYSGDPLAPGLSNGQESAAFGAAHVQTLARAHGVSRARVAPSPFSGAAVVVMPEQPPITPACTAAQRLIELKDEAHDLWHGVRRSYRSLIHRAEARYTLMAYDHTAPDAVAGFSAYRTLHRRLARLPRADETYRLQEGWLLSGLALVMVAERELDGVLGAAYWLIYKGCAYYASGAYAEDDLAHAVVWRSLLALRERGVTRVSLGWQGRARTEKERAIEFFKRGFGGADVPTQVIEVLFLSTMTERGASR